MGGGGSRSDRLAFRPCISRPPGSAADAVRFARSQLADQGVTRLSLFHIGADIKAGRLVPLLEAYNPGDVEEVNVVYVGHGGRLPARVRAFIDFLVADVNLDLAPRSKAS
jgi:DNA-binding transcriptional LysR family regulator